MWSCFFLLLLLLDKFVRDCLLLCFFVVASSDCIAWVPACTRTLECMYVYNYVDTCVKIDGYSWTEAEKHNGPTLPRTAHCDEVRLGYLVMLAIVAYLAVIAYP